MKKHSIGKTIADLRKKNGWTQVELAEKLNVSDKAISKWESEAGFPEISQLPVMAELFNVSIDYLMTGKTSNQKITTMSKAELCAKNDDVSLASSVKRLHKDENGKDIVDYILKYLSFNVFKKLCEDDSEFIKRFELLDALKLTILSNSLSILRSKEFQVEGNCKFRFDDENEIKSLLPLEDKDYFQDYLDKCSCILPRTFFKMIVTDKRINEETMNVLLSPQKGRDCVWYHAFPYMIEEAYKNNKKSFLKRLLDISKKNNSLANEIKVTYDGYYGYSHISHYFFITNRNRNKNYGIVRILESTIKLALNNGDFDLVDEFNEINSEVKSLFTKKIKNDKSSICYVASEDEIRVARLKLDKSISEVDLCVQAAIHNGIISIKELSQINDYATAKNALYDYPIHPFELFYKLYQEKNWKKLFEIAIDNDIRDLRNALISNDNIDIEKAILNIWKNDKSNFYSESLCINNDEIYVDRNEIKYSGKIARTQSNFEEINKYLSDVRQRIINEISNKFNKEKIVEELTKEYFYSELEKGNRDMVIIKLCVRMETILKCDYHYEGDFSEMLDIFCSHFNTDDDEGNNYDPYTPELLNKLRRQRNGIVHSEKSSVKLSDNEIKQCIDYICSL